MRNLLEGEEGALLYEPRDCGECKNVALISWLCPFRDTFIPCLSCDWNLQRRRFCCTSQKPLQTTADSSPTILRAGASRVPTVTDDFQTTNLSHLQICLLEFHMIHNSATNGLEQTPFQHYLDPAQGIRSPPRHFTVPAGRPHVPRLLSKFTNVDTKTLTHKAIRKLRTPCSGQ